MDSAGEMGLDSCSGAPSTASKAACAIVGFAFLEVASRRGLCAFPGGPCCDSWAERLSEGMGYICFILPLVMPRCSRHVLYCQLFQRCFPVQLVDIDVTFFLVVPAHFHTGPCFVMTQVRGRGICGNATFAAGACSLFLCLLAQFVWAQDVFRGCFVSTCSVVFCRHLRHLLRAQFRRHVSQVVLDLCLDCILGR